MTTSLFGLFVAAFKRDMTMYMRRKGEVLNPSLFFFMVITLFPLAVSPEKSVLSTMAPGIIWVAALLATLLSLDQLFRSDFEDGTLEQLVLSTQPISVVMLAKILAHWCVSSVPLILLSPILAGMLGLQANVVGVLVLTLLIGTPVLSLLGAIGAGLTVGLRKGGMLLSLIILPLYTPIIIFGAGAAVSANSGMAYAGHLAILGVMLSLAFVLTPLATGYAVKISISE